MLKSRLGLSVLVFTDFRDQFTVVDDLQQIAPLPRADGRQNAAADRVSPDVRAAEASVQQETLGVGVARGGVLPSLSFDYFYGINANQFATYGSGRHNGCSARSRRFSSTCRFVNWGAAQSKLRQAQLARAAPRSAS